MVNIWVQGSDILGLTHLMIVDLGPKKKKKHNQCIDCLRIIITMKKKILHLMTF